MAISKVCGTPSDTLQLISDPIGAAAASALFGIIAEALIEGDYLSKRPGKVFVDHFFDNALAASYIAFLAFHNPHIRNPRTLAQLAILTNLPGGGIVRPDIVTDQAGIQEYYEIKPDSAAGLAAGRLKMLAIDAFMGSFRLPYGRGPSYTPASSLPLASGTIPVIVGTPVPFTATLEPKRTMPGLIQYKVCVETDFLLLGVNALVIIAIIILLILLKRLPGRLPVPVPIPRGLPIPLF
jgi:hypothetical protein